MSEHRAPGPPDPPARSLRELAEPGPVRARALNAAAAALRKDVGLCGDRCRTAATHAIDAAVRAAERDR